MRVIKIRNLKNGTTTVSGLTDGDLRLIANVLEEGAYQGGDRGGPVSDAVLRLAHAVRTAAMFDGHVGDSDLAAGVFGSDLYAEVAR